MEFYKLKYYLKRLGFTGIFKRILNKMGLIDFNVYEHIYYNYYSKLKKQDYKKELIAWYRYMSGENKNPLESPRSFNEKIQWLKINDASPVKTICADKLKVRSYIEEKLGSGYLIELYGVYDSFEDIDFEKLPEKMIFKSTTGSGRYEIIKNKENVDYKKLKKKIDTWQDLPFGYAGMEIHYLDIERKIICEKLLNMQGPSVVDYKFHCFNGKPLLIEYMSDRKDGKYKESWFDTNWNKVKITIDDKRNANHKNLPQAPENLDKMLEIARILAKDFYYVRVDLYQIEGKIYFGELTFTPANGMEEWNEKESHNLVGDLIRLPYEDKLNKEQIDAIINKLLVDKNI